MSMHESRSVQAVERTCGYERTCAPLRVRRPAEETRERRRRGRGVGGGNMTMREVKLWKLVPMPARTCMETVKL